MNNGQIGAIVGLLLGIVWVVSSFPAMLLVAVLGIVGWIIGRFVQIDVEVIKQKIATLLSK